MRTQPTVRRTLSRRLAAFLVVPALLFAACGGETGIASGGADTVSEGRRGDLIASGETLYGAWCAECHGADLRGTDQGPSHLSVVYEPNHHGDVAFQMAVQFGTPAHHWPFGDMAPIPDLTVEEIEAITAYVREVQRREGFEPYPP
ncbi:MAG: cytochrome c [Acidimicrobiia bacterium]|nr:cytochrome c [Acidimicrobiia bacterium]